MPMCQNKYICTRSFGAFGSVNIASPSSRHSVVASVRALGSKKARFFHRKIFNTPSTCFEANPDNDPLIPTTWLPHGCKPTKILMLQPLAGGEHQINLVCASLRRLEPYSTSVVFRAKHHFNLKGHGNFPQIDAGAFCMYFHPINTVLCSYEDICTPSKLFTKRKPL